MEGHGAYGVSKHALVAYSDTLRQEMKKWDVKVSIIEPTGYATGEYVMLSCLTVHQLNPIALRIAKTP